MRKKKCSTCRPRQPSHLLPIATHGQILCTVDLFCISRRHRARETGAGNPSSCAQDPPNHAPAHAFSTVSLLHLKRSNECALVVQCIYGLFRSVLEVTRYSCTCVGVNTFKACPRRCLFLENSCLPRCFADKGVWFPRQRGAPFEGRRRCKKSNCVPGRGEQVGAVSVPGFCVPRTAPATVPTQLFPTTDVRWDIRDGREWMRGVDVVLLCDCDRDWAIGWSSRLEVGVVDDAGSRRQQRNCEAKWVQP